MVGWGGKDEKRKKKRCKQDQALSSQFSGIYIQYTSKCIDRPAGSIMKPKHQNLEIFFPQKIARIDELKDISDTILFLKFPDFGIMMETNMNMTDKLTTHSK